MPVIDGIVQVTSTQGVSLGDISTGIGLSSLDLGTLCKSTLINKWAKYKPIRHSNVGYVTESDRATAKQGMTVTKYTFPTTLRDNFANEWAYLQPREGQSPQEWFRAFDFIQVNNSGVPVVGHGYNRKAAVPISGWFNKPEGEHYLGTIDLLASFGLRPSAQTPQDQDSVKLSDVSQDATGFGDMYLGIMLFYGTTLANSTYAGLKTYTDSGGTVRNISWLESNNIQFVDISFTDADLPVPNGAASRTYYFMPVISVASAATLDTNTNKYTGGIYAVPNADIATLIVKPASSANFLVVQAVSHEFSYGGGRLSVSVPTRMWGTRGTYAANIYYDLYANETGTGTTLSSGTFYSGTVPQTPSYTSYTYTYNSRMEMPEYLTLVLKDANTQAELLRITDFVTSEDL